MITLVTLDLQGEGQLESVASTLTTLEGVQEVRAIEPTSIEIVWDAAILDEGELLTLIGEDGIRVVDIRSQTR